MARKFFVGGNWKCNGTKEEVEKIVPILNEADVPFENIVAQNKIVVYGYDPPFLFTSTGEISAEMLVNLGIPWLISGIFERRLLLGESNEFLGDNQGLKVIAYVGETLDQRELGSSMDIVAAQTKAMQVHVSLRKWLQINVGAEIAASTRIVYGGSVQRSKLQRTGCTADIDGFLVGGASLKPEFVYIKSSLLQ